MPRLLSKRIVFDVKKVLMLYSENIQYAIIGQKTHKPLNLILFSFSFHPQKHGLKVPKLGLTCQVQLVYLLIFGRAWWCTQVV